MAQDSNSTPPSGTSKGTASGKPDANVSDRIEAAREQLASVQELTENWVRENPYLAVLGGVAAGFVIARLLKSRT